MCPAVSVTMRSSAAGVGRAVHDAASTSWCAVVWILRHVWQRAASSSRPSLGLTMASRLLDGWSCAFFARARHARFVLSDPAPASPPRFSVVPRRAHSASWCLLCASTLCPPLPDVRSWRLVVFLIFKAAVPCHLAPVRWLDRCSPGVVLGSQGSSPRRQSPVTTAAGCCVWCLERVCLGYAGRGGVRVVSRRGEKLCGGHAGRGRVSALAEVCFSGDICRRAPHWLWGLPWMSVAARGWT